MAGRLKRLLEERANAWSQVQDIRTRLEREGRDPSTEENETFERGLADVERLSEEIEREERAERLGGVVDAIDPSQRSTNPTAEDHEDRDASAEYQEAFARYLRSGMGRLSPDEQRMLEQGFVETESRAQGAGVDAAGGYTVPEEFLTRMTESLKAFGGILGVADVIPTSTGADLRWPTNDDTNNKGALLSENTQVTEQDFTFGSVPLKAHTYTSKMVRVSLQLLQDSAFNLNVWLPGKLGQRIGRASAEHFAVGDGVDKPQGLTVGLSGVETSTVGAIKYDDLIDLEHAVDPAYRQSGRVRYVGHDTAIAAFRKLKNSNGDPIWQPSVREGIPSTINGIPYTVDNDMPALANGAAPLVFGDIASAYVIRQVRGAQTLRLTERYADFLQVGFLGFMRLDGKVNDASAAKKLTIRAA